MSLQKLAGFLEQSRKERTRGRVTLLPDLFIDQIITIPETSGEFLSKARRILKRGGGNYTGVTAELQLGGCGANCAAALSRLRVSTSLISKTAAIGKYVLLHASNSRYLDASHVKTEGKLAITAAIETHDIADSPNLMITYPGSIRAFSPDDLDERDLALIKESSIVGIFSWNLNERGTELLERVTGLCAESDVQTYVDIGDPTPRIRKLPKLVDRVLRDGKVNYLSVNENELRSLCKTLAINGWQKRSAQDLAEEVADQLPIELALHTSAYAGLAKGRTSIFRPSFKILPRRTTGAGDAWNAGNIFALLKEVDRGTRLMMANLLAARYVSSPQRGLPSLLELSKYVRLVRPRLYNNLS